MKPQILALGLLMAGCGAGTDYFPTTLGEKHDYSVRGEMAQFVDTFKVVRDAPVMGVSGVEFAGNSGTSRFGWKGGVLYASLLGGIKYSPPIPILAPNDFAPRKWKGSIDISGKKILAEALLEQEREPVQIGSRNFDTIKSSLRISYGVNELRLISNFASGIGLVKQNEWLNDAHRVSLDLIH